MDNLFCDGNALFNTAEYLKWPQSIVSNAWQALHIITRAQTIHECLHILYSDFPPKATSEPKCKNKLQRKVLAHIANIIEDAYIEAVGCSVYDNMDAYLRFGRVSRLFASQPTRGSASRLLQETCKQNEEPSETQHRIKILLEYLNYMCLFLLYPFVD